VQLRYSPSPPSWVLATSLISFVAVLAIVFQSVVLGGSRRSNSSAL
jgi:hypothetical protein